MPTTSRLAALTRHASATFTFPLGSGFTGLDSPATFLKFNRALRARVAVYHGKFDDALAAIAASFIDDSLPFKAGTGAYHAFSGGAGDPANDLNTTDILCHCSVVTDAEALTPPNVGCTNLACLDNRVSSKVTKLDKPIALSNHSSGYAYTL